MADTANRFAKLIGELCRRNTSVVFAASYGQNDVHVQWKRDGDPVIAQGLASRIAHEVADTLSAKGDREARPMEDISQQIRDTYPPITDWESLALVPNPLLLTELYRIPSCWILGLQKQTRKGRLVQFFLHYGPAVTCCGLAMILQHRIGMVVSGAIDQANGQNPAGPLEARTRELLSDLPDHSDEHPLYVGGLCAQITFEANRFRGRGPGSMNCAEDYVESDGPVLPGERRP